MIVQIILFQRILLNDYEFGANPKSTYVNLVQLRSIALALASQYTKLRIMTGRVELRTSTNP